MIPQVKDCFKFMEKYQMLDHIRAHSIIVEKVARIIARGLQDAGMVISLKKITAGALMHDIGKTPCLNTNEDHSAKGREICLQNDLSDIADIVGEHVFMQNYELSETIHEKEIVYYSDKRVKHDAIVSLEERLQYLIERYGKNREHLIQLLRENFDLCRRVEKKLFAKLNFNPEDLAGMMKGGGEV